MERNLTKYVFITTNFYDKSYKLNITILLFSILLTLKYIYKDWNIAFIHY